MALRKAVMSGSEALVETLRVRGVRDVWGITGSAFIPPLDLFDRAGIRFRDVKHEQNGVDAANALGRITGRPGVVIGQNGPGITNMLTGVATADYCNAPVLVISPQAGTTTIGRRGFQELDQLPAFSNVTRFQATVPHASRIAELTGLAYDRAVQLRGPTQINIPRDYFFEEHEVAVPPPLAVGKAQPDGPTTARIVELLTGAKRPVILAGGGLDPDSCVGHLATMLHCPVATTYLHNDVHPLGSVNAVGSIGYMGSKAAMRCVADADVVLALGTRINPFGVNPQHGIDYWGAGAKRLIQVDHNPAALGVSCAPEIAVCADAKATAAAIFTELRLGYEEQCTPPPIPFERYRDEWAAELRASSAQPDGPGALRPKAVLQAFQDYMEGVEIGSVVTTDIGHCCSQALSYVPRNARLLTAGTFGSCGTAISFAIGAKTADPATPAVALVGDGAATMQGINELITVAADPEAAITVVVFKNGLWGAEALNQLIWCDARTTGTELRQPSVAGIAEAMGAVGKEVRTLPEFEAALEAAVGAQADGVTTLIEVECTPEMGAPFRSDAMQPVQYHLDRYADLSVAEAQFGRQYTAQ